jgi:hypothetical protein
VAESRKKYARHLCLIKPTQREEIRRLSGELKYSQNEVVRRALHIGLPILEMSMKSGIDNDKIGDIIKEVND